MASAAALGRAGMAVRTLPPVDRVDPRNVLRLLGRLNVEVDDDGLVVAAHQHAFERLVRARVDLLVRHVRRHEDEVTRAGLGGEFEPIAPPHPRFAAHDVDHAFQRAVVMRAGLRVGMDADGPGPELLGTGAREIDRGLAVHAWRLRRIRVERMAGDDAHAIMFPSRITHPRTPSDYIASRAYCPRLAA